MSAYPPPNRLGSMVQSLLTGQFDHGSLLRVPDLHSRGFWLGAAIGAGAVLLLKSRASAGSTTVHGVGLDQPTPPEA